MYWLLNLIKVFQVNIWLLHKLNIRKIVQKISRLSNTRESQYFTDAIFNFCKRNPTVADKGGKGFKAFSHNDELFTDINNLLDSNSFNIRLVNFWSFVKTNIHKSVKWLCLMPIKIFNILQRIKKLEDI